MPWGVELLRGKPTIRDVAELAGVSISTVSRVLNGKDTVNSYLKEKVLEAVKQLNFQPSKVAQSFRKKLQQISIVVGQWTEPILRLLTAIVEKLDEFGVHVNLSTSLENTYADFIVLLSEHLVRDNRISLQIGCETDGHSIFFDHDNTVKKLLEQFISVGKRSFALLSEELSNYRAYRMYTTFIKVMFKHGIEKYEFLKVDGEKGIMNLSFLPEVVLCSNDRIALETISILTEEGLNVPNQISVVGYGNFEFSQFVSPSITTVEYMTKEDGKFCAEIIQKLLTEDQVENKVLLKTRIIPRNSAMMSI